MTNSNPEYHDGQNSASGSNSNTYWNNTEPPVDPSPVQDSYGSQDPYGAQGSPGTQASSYGQNYGLSQSTPPQDPYGASQNPSFGSGQQDPYAGQQAYGQGPYTTQQPYSQDPYAAAGGYAQQNPYSGTPQNTYGTPQNPYGGPQTPYGAPYGGGMVYASWGKRAQAAVIDIIAVSLLIGIITFPIFNAMDIDATDPSPGRSLIQNVISWALIGVIWGVYSGNTGQSVGRKWAGTMLVGEDGKPIGTGKTILHYVLHIIDSTLCLIGFLWPLWDTKRQTLSDKILNTYVIDVSPQANPYGSPYPPM